MDLKDYMLNAGKVPQRQLKYYLIWISKYNGYSKRYPQNDLQDYLDSLSEKYEDWQVVQAGKAVNLYKYYLTVHSDKKETAAVKIPVSWTEIEAKVKETCKFQYKSYSTEKSYLYWIRTFGRYLGNKELENISEKDVKNFLTYLAVQRRLAASTQKQAFIALLYFFRNVLFKEISNLNDVVRSSKYKKLPLVLSKDEIQLILRQMQEKSGDGSGFSLQRNCPVIPERILFEGITFTRVLCKKHFILRFCHRGLQKMLQSIL